MYFTKVELHNFGIYKGTHEMCLTDKIGNRNITLDDAFMKKCELLQKNGLATIDNNSIKLTRKGLLVQNQVLGFLM